MRGVPATREGARLEAAGTERPTHTSTQPQTPLKLRDSPCTGTTLATMMIMLLFLLRDVTEESSAGTTRCRERGGGANPNTSRSLTHREKSLVLCFLFFLFAC